MLLVTVCEFYGKAGSLSSVWTVRTGAKLQSSSVGDQHSAKFKDTLAFPYSWLKYLGFPPTPNHLAAVSASFVSTCTAGVQLAVCTVAQVELPISVGHNFLLLRLHGHS